MDQEAKREPFSTRAMLWRFQNGLSSDMGPWEPSFTIPQRKQEGWRGKVWLERCLPGSGPAPPLPLGPGANPDSYPLQLSRFLLLGPAALPQPSRCPLPQPPPPPLLLGWVGRAAAWGSRGLYLACGGRAVGAEARRSSWSQS